MNLTVDSGKLLSINGQSSCLLHFTFHFFFPVFSALKRAGLKKKKKSIFDCFVCVGNL